MFFKARPCVCVSVWVTDIGTCAWFKEQGLRVCVHMVPAGCLGAFRGAPPLKTAPFRTSLPVPTLDLTEGGCPSLQNEKRGKKHRFIQSYSTQYVKVHFPHTQSNSTP